MAGGSNHEIWVRFIEADYLKDACTREGKCPTCNSQRDCNNYYCLLCKVGGLCPTTFRENGHHISHPWLQVRRQTGYNAVATDDLKRLIGLESTKHIHKASLNNQYLCYLKTKIPESPTEPTNNSSKLNSKTLASASKCARKRIRKSCEGCGYRIPKSDDCREEFFVCSLQCLVVVAQLHPEKNLLQLKDDAMNFTRPPKTSNEKLAGHSKAIVLAKGPMDLDIMPIAIGPPALPMAAPIEATAMIDRPRRTSLSENRLTTKLVRSSEKRTQARKSPIVSLKRSRLVVPHPYEDPPPHPSDGVPPHPCDNARGHPPNSAPAHPSDGSKPCIVCGPSSQNIRPESLPNHSSNKVLNLISYAMITSDWNKHLGACGWN